MGPIRRAGAGLVTIEIVEPGVLTTVQDAIGRREWSHLGVPVGGAADSWSARLANRLVGNPDDAALLECTLLGPTIRFEAAHRFALVGRLAGTLDGLPVPLGVAGRARAGSLLRIGHGPEARAWLAVGGGVTLPSVLGSTSTDIRSSFGGLDGRALRAGDRLPIGESASVTLRRTSWPQAIEDEPIGIMPGPHATAPALDGLAGGAWRVGPEADRIGVRLEGATITGLPAQVPSMGLPLGAVQVPPDGRPIVMLVDRPVTGGYPVPAVVVAADAGRLARLRPGDPLRLASVSRGEAMRRLREREARLSELEPVPDQLDELGWTGAHE